MHLPKLSPLKLVRFSRFLILRCIRGLYAVSRRLAEARCWFSSRQVAAQTSALFQAGQGEAVTLHPASLGLFFDFLGLCSGWLLLPWLARQATCLPAMAPATGTIKICHPAPCQGPPFLAPADSAALFRQDQGLFSSFGGRGVLRIVDAFGWFKGKPRGNNPFWVLLV